MGYFELQKWNLTSLIFHLTWVPSLHTDDQIKLAIFFSCLVFIFYALGEQVLMLHLQGQLSIKTKK